MRLFFKKWIVYLKSVFNLKPLETLFIGIYSHPAESIYVTDLLFFFFLIAAVKTVDQIS